MSEYNGWKNYETWACFSWLTNDGRVEALLYDFLRKAREKGEDPAEKLKEIVIMLEKSQYDDEEVKNMFHDIKDIEKIDFKQLSEMWR